MMEIQSESWKQQQMIIPSVSSVINVISHYKVPPSLLISQIPTPPKSSSHSHLNCHTCAIQLFNHSPQTNTPTATTIHTDHPEPSPPSKTSSAASNSTLTVPSTPYRQAPKEFFTIHTQVVIRRICGNHVPHIHVQIQLERPLPLSHHSHPTAQRPQTAGLFGSKQAFG